MLVRFVFLDLPQEVRRVTDGMNQGGVKKVTGWSPESASREAEAETRVMDLR